MSLMEPSDEPRWTGDEIGQEECDRIQAIMDEADACADLSAWETEFCQSIGERLATYGERSFISEKQLAAIARIERKLAD